MESDNSQVGADHLPERPVCKKAHKQHHFIKEKGIIDFSRYNEEEAEALVEAMEKKRKELDERIMKYIAKRQKEYDSFEEKLASIVPDSQKEKAAKENEKLLSPAAGVTTREVSPTKERGRKLKRPEPVDTHLGVGQVEAPQSSPGFDTKPDEELRGLFTPSFLPLLEGREGSGERRSSSVPSRTEEGVEKPRKPALRQSYKRSATEPMVKPSLAARKSALRSPNSSNPSHRKRVSLVIDDHIVRPSESPDSHRTPRPPRRSWSASEADSRATSPDSTIWESPAEQSIAEIANLQKLQGHHTEQEARQHVASFGGTMLPSRDPTAQSGLLASDDRTSAKSHSLASRPGSRSTAANALSSIISGTGPFAASSQHLMFGRSGSAKDKGKAKHPSILPHQVPQSPSPVSSEAPSPATSSPPTLNTPSSSQFPKSPLPLPFTTTSALPPSLTLAHGGSSNASTGATSTGSPKKKLGTNPHHLHHDSTSSSSLTNTSSSSSLSTLRNQQPPSISTMPQDLRAEHLEHAPAHPSQSISTPTRGTHNRPESAREPPSDASLEGDVFAPGADENDDASASDSGPEFLEDINARQEATKAARALDREDGLPTSSYVGGLGGSGLDDADAASLGYPSSLGASYMERFWKVRHSSGSHSTTGPGAAGSQRGGMSMSMPTGGSMKERMGREKRGSRREELARQGNEDEEDVVGSLDL